MTPVIGTAGWSIPRTDAECFPRVGSSLERYAARLGGVEVNSSFYRSHRASTWARWAASVPEGFRFAVKIPRVISHERGLVGCGDALSAFLAGVLALGEKLDVLLLQLPPRFEYDEAVLVDFVARLRACCAAGLVCEPRHASWFAEHVDDRLERLGVTRAAADPALVPQAGRPGGWRGISYWRLHGSPRMYRSRYDEAWLAALQRGSPQRPGKAGASSTTPPQARLRATRCGSRPG
jgi:uncharacterized protein YecE (DUF72 family)